jgi:S1-C subfamily serine protease
MNIVALTTLFALVLPSASEAKKQSLIYQEIKSSVRLEAIANGLILDGINTKSLVVASGFAISENYFISAAHFCAKSLQMRVSKIDVTALNNEFRLYKLPQANIRFLDSESDICILELQNHGLKPVVAAEKLPQIGDSVTSVGAPFGFFPVVKSGYIISPSLNTDTQTVLPTLNNKLVFSGKVNFGNSGGPLYNEYGKFIGMVLQVFASDDEIGFVLPASEIYKIWIAAEKLLKQEK